MNKQNKKVVLAQTIAIVIGHISGKQFSFIRVFKTVINNCIYSFFFISFSEYQSVLLTAQFNISIGTVTANSIKLLDISICSWFQNYVNRNQLPIGTQKIRATMRQIAKLMDII